MRQEPGPTLGPNALRRVERPPLGADRPAPGLHAGLLRRAVGLEGVAPDAGGNTVGPARRTSLRARYDVVDRNRLGAGLRPAVLAGVMVALRHIPPAERHRRPGQAVVVRQADDLGGPEAAACRPPAPGAVPGAALPPPRPGV